MYMRFAIFTIPQERALRLTPPPLASTPAWPTKNGVKIFDGDIVKWGHIPGYRENPVRTAEVKIAPDIQFDAIICNTRTVFHYGAFAYAGRIDKALEVIGSIHDVENESKK